MSVITVSGALTTVTGPGSVVTLIGPTVTLPGEVTTLPGQITTVAGQVTTLPGVVTTVPGQVTTVPGQIITLPGIVTTITGTPTTVPSVVTTLLSIVTTIIGTPTTPPGVITTLTVSSAHTVTPVAVCPVPSPIYTPATTPPFDYTWGCPPGTVCSPSKPAGCDVFADPPPVNYICQPSECIPAPDFTPVIWPEGETSYYPPPFGYFDLSPLAFGLSSDIFAADVVVQYGAGNQPQTTITTGNWQSQASITEAYALPTSPPSLARRKWWEEAIHLPDARLSKRASSTVPAVCFATCNNCQVIAQQTGKTPALCAPTSAFLSYLAACRQCVAANGDATQSTLKRYVEPQFAQFLGFCDVLGAQSVVRPLAGATGAQSAVTGGVGGVVTQGQGAADTRTDVLTISGGGGEVVVTSTRGEVVVTSTRGDVVVTSTASALAVTGTRTSVVGTETTRTTVETPVRGTTVETRASGTSSASGASPLTTVVVTGEAPRLGREGLGLSALVGFLLATLMLV